ncbi:DNA repair protein RecO [Alkaliphilus hydrothermalis]|uniref:DNA repair protein RecO n=1 Tax=Alkaliphilus hydrothermalis TaxID=1482730 RepID=A0ABS2NNW3_9FIRM|nr:DNA repair protein RecO [Alkaliphilus hydrothermalis]MBM7614638.1 DNA repair protein RecO (recombination protein O) [Alkaliphilus hydrothermalis]
MLIKTEGFVLKNKKYGETDSMLTIFTRKIGKINAIAKGARKPKSTFLAGIQPFCYSDFVFYKGKSSLYNLSQCDAREIFYCIREDLDALTYGAYLLELVEAVTNEGQTNNRLFNLLGKTLSMLANKDQKDFELQTVVRAFEVNLLAYSGFKPHVHSCVNCNQSNFKQIKFSHEEGGILCPKCFTVDPFASKISETTVRLANYLLNKDILEIQKLKVNEALNNELKLILKKYIMVHINKYQFKSLDMLDKL